MATVIFKNCKMRYENDVDEGKAYYRYIFLQQKYKKYKAEVDNRLINAGLSDCIVDIY